MSRQKAPQILLAQALKDRGIGYKRAVDEHGLPLHWAHLQKVIKGDRGASFAFAVAVEREFGIPADAWPHLRDPVGELLRLRGMGA